MSWFHYPDGRSARWFAKGSKFDPDHLVPLLLLLAACAAGFFLSGCCGSRGGLGELCNRDGSCIGKLQCVQPDEWLGIPVDHATCRVAK